jgi:hypothetical protein
LLLHRGEKKLFLGITVGMKFEQCGADLGDLLADVSGGGCWRFQLVLQQEALELIVVDADGDNDGRESVIVGRETAGDYLRSAVEAAN